MTKIRQNILRIIGVVGVIACISIFLKAPSFPTPDKLLIFLVFIFLMFKQALAMLKRLAPFVAVLLVYESFRGLADKLNTQVDYLVAPNIDKFVFSDLPTVTLQNWLWHGHVQWYDFIFYLAYMLHFIIPVGLAILVWKTREKYYWRTVNTFAAVAFMAFLTYLLFPAAPPWMASEKQYIEPITRISSDVWFALGIHDFPSVYNKISPNAVAAVPSLHAAWATLLPIFIYKFYGRRLAILAAVYPALIYIGTVYQGEHYAFDVLLGMFYATGAYFVTPYLMRKFVKLQVKFRAVLNQGAPVIPKAVKNKKNNNQIPKK